MKDLAKWARAVWLEDDVEKEFVVPSSWVSLDKRIVLWPPKSQKSQIAVKKMKVPDDRWRKFNLVKVKTTSGMINYAYFCLGFDFGES